MNRINKSEKLFGIKLIAIVNGIAAIFHLLFWTAPITRLTLLIPQIQAPTHIDIATIYGLGIADLILSPLLVIGSIGLWKMKPIGWLAAQFVNVLYWYSQTLIFAIGAVSGIMAFGTFVFLPFVFFSFWAAFYLWKTRSIIIQ